MTRGKEAFVTILSTGLIDNSLLTGQMLTMNLLKICGKCGNIALLVNAPLTQALRG